MTTIWKSAAGTVNKRPYPSLEVLLSEVRACRVCAEHLPLGPRPVLRARADARILIVGQAPAPACTLAAFRGMTQAANDCENGLELMFLHFMTSRASQSSRWGFVILGGTTAAISRRVANVR